jgi:hypothetical protein
MYYNARYYDISLGRFTSADTIVPGAGNPGAWDRFAYAMNSPVSMVDPTGHRTCTPEEAATGDETCDENAGTAEEDFEPTIGAAYIILLIKHICTLMGCRGNNVDFIEVDFGFLQNVLGYDAGIIHLPIHINPGSAGQRYSWEGVANSLWNEQGGLHPSYFKETPEHDFFNQYWLGDAMGIAQAMENQTTYQGPNGEVYECFGQTPNDCAMSGSFAAPNRPDDYLDNTPYGETYAVAFAVIAMNVRVDQSYSEFRHRDTDPARNGGAPVGSSGINYGPYVDRAVFGDPNSVGIYYLVPSTPYYE